MDRNTHLRRVRGKRVFVGLSGGVDSAVSAALLQQAGAHVTGVFIKGWYPPGMPCTWADDRRDAMRAAAHLRIPFRTLDASGEYKEGVIDYLLREYKAGRTPNPDVMCNREVKFGAFYRYAMAEGAEYIATGHYVQIGENDEGVSLIRGVDAAKDQSYFLWAVPKNAISATIFPVGGVPKARVRELAAQFDLPNALKRDSQGICFLGTISVEDFLRNEFGSEPGEAVDERGTRVGIHDGAVLHTLGERVRLEGAAAGPWYVLRKDIAKNLLVVAHERAAAGGAPLAVPLTETNWLKTVRTDEPIEAQYRYHGPRISGTLDQAANTFTPARPLTEPLASGQSLVAYRGDACLGGGIIG